MILSFVKTEKTQAIDIGDILLEDRAPLILHIQYHGCWCPGDTRSQGISSHGIGLLLLEYSSFSTRKVNNVQALYCTVPSYVMLFWYTASFCMIASMMMSSNGNIFRVTDHLCGEFTGHRWIPHTKASDTELWCFLWSASELSKRSSKRSWGWWFETLSRPLWCHYNAHHPWLTRVASSWLLCKNIWNCGRGGRMLDRELMGFWQRLGK